MLAQEDKEVMSGHHDYIQRLHQGIDPFFNESYREKHDKYFGMLDTVEAQGAPEQG